jgi:hypothetical protein
VYHTFSNAISNTGPHYSMTMNISVPKTIIPDDVFKSYRLAQAKIAPYPNKMNLEIPGHHCQIILIGQNLIYLRKIWCGKNQTWC